MKYLYYSVLLAAWGTAHASAITSCPDLSGAFSCPAPSQNEPSVKFVITQQEVNGITDYHYEYTFPDHTEAADYLASPAGVTAEDGIHLFCSNDVLYTEDTSTPHSTNYYFISSASGNYVAGRIGRAPITCERQDQATALSGGKNR